MRNSQTLASLRYAGQEVTQSADTVRIVTTLRSERGYACEHRLRYREGDLAFTVDTVFLNEAERPFSLELLASFALSGDHHMAVVCESSSPYTQLAVPYLMRSLSLPSVVSARSFAPDASLSQRLRSL